MDAQNEPEVDQLADKEQEFKEIYKGSTKRGIHIFSVVNDFENHILLLVSKFSGERVVTFKLYAEFRKFRS